MRLIARTVIATLAAVTAAVFLLPGVASADNCGSLSDCYYTARAALAALAGLSILFGVLLSMALDFVPGVGTAKGIAEAITGRDLITGQELAWWERVLGIVPVLGGVAGAAGALSRGARAVDDIADAGRGIDHAADAARDVERAADVARDSRGRIIPAEVQRLPSGRLPANWHYAGRTFDGPTWTPRLQERYPDGVIFTRDGFPDFSPYSSHTVRFEPPGFEGNHGSDFRQANARSGLPETPDGYTWHHHQDGQTMQLVPTEVHDAVRHAGGVAIKRGG